MTQLRSYTSSRRLYSLLICGRSLGGCPQSLISAVAWTLHYPAAEALMLLVIQRHERLRKNDRRSRSCKIMQVKWTNAGARCSSVLAAGLLAMAQLAGAYKLDLSSTGEAPAVAGSSNLWLGIYWINMGLCRFYQDNCGLHGGRHDVILPRTSARRNPWPSPRSILLVGSRCPHGCAHRLLVLHRRHKVE